MFVEQILLSNYLMLMVLFRKNWQLINGTLTLLKSSLKCIWSWKIPAWMICNWEGNRCTYHVSWCLVLKTFKLEGMRWMQLNMIFALHLLTKLHFYKVNSFFICFSIMLLGLFKKQILNVSDSRKRIYY